MLMRRLTLALALTLPGRWPQIMDVLASMLEQEALVVERNKDASFRADPWTRMNTLLSKATSSFADPTLCTFTPAHNTE